MSVSARGVTSTDGTAVWRVGPAHVEPHRGYLAIDFKGAEAARRVTSFVGTDPPFGVGVSIPEGARLVLYVCLVVFSFVACLNSFSLCRTGFTGPQAFQE